MPDSRTSAIELSATGEPLPLASFFAPDGPVARAIKGFEPRKQQEEMAAAVYSALTEKKHLIVEAGTGVGKSLAKGP